MFDGKSKCVVILYVIAVRLANILICFCSALPSPTCNQDLCCHTHTGSCLLAQSSATQFIFPGDFTCTSKYNTARTGVGGRE